MQLRFSKMHGLGNDFVVLDLISQRYRPSTQDMRFLADRHLGIGCDQILLIEAPEYPENDFKYRIFNADGSEVEQCGNGARCFAKYVQDKGLTGKKHIRVETENGIITLCSNSQGVQVDMGAPRFAPSALPFNAEQQQNEYLLELAEQTITIGAVSMGNPHVITLVEDIQSAPVTTLGPQIESHARFPQRVNAGFMQIINEQHVKLRVYERGAGETRACGTGACAAVVYGIRQGLLTSPVAVELPGGTLKIAYAGENNPVLMTGPASHVFDGKIRL